jgi:hypothetical protein
MALLLLQEMGLWGGAKTNVPFIEVLRNFKIFVRGQSPDRWG